MSTAIAVKERPILFSGPMVRAILDGHKTQTRRAVKPQPPEGWSPLEVERYHPAYYDGDGMMYDGPEIFGAYNEDWGTACQYGGPGDRLWVRETWGELSWTCVIGEVGRQRTEVVYKAGPHSFERDRPHGWTDGKNKWRPSIHMPRCLSRITLEITGVRVERLQDIGKDGRKASDVLAEGVTPEAIANERKWFHPDDSPAIAFSRLWESINGKGSWEANPWVWVLEFKRVEAT